MKPQLTVRIGDISFKNPVLAASGTFGYAKEFERFFDLRRLGGIVTKTLTLKARAGNAPRRVFETPSGMLNAIGLQNVGVENFIREKLPFLRGLGIPVIASVMGYSVREFRQVIEALEGARGLVGYELNLSCPNVEYEKSAVPETGDASEDEVSPGRAAKMFAHDDRMVFKVVRDVRGLTRRLLIAKLAPDVSDIARMAVAAERGGADAVSLINTFSAMAIDVRTRKPVLKNCTGGLSGPCIRPIAVRMVWEVARNVRVPVLGMGGIMRAEDAIEFFLAGATCVQVGTANFIHPAACPAIIKGIEHYLREQKIPSIRHLIGKVAQP